MRLSERGLTLVETLVALAIMGLTAASILTLIGQNTRFIISAEEKTFASVAADNLMVEALALATLDRGEETGDIEINGRRYSFVRRVEDSTAEELAVVEIEVRSADGAQVLASATSLRRER